MNFFKSKNQKEAFNLLEVGCNSGHNLKALYDIYPESQYTGIDILPDAIEEAKTYLPTAKYYVFDIEDPPASFQDNKYDYILFLDVLQHLSQPEKALNYFKTYLKPDGYMIINVPNLTNWRTIHELIINGNFTYTPTGLLDFDHKHLFTYNELVRMLGNNGFEIDQIQCIISGLIPDEMQDFINKLIELSQNKRDVFQYEAFTYMTLAHIKKEQPSI